MFQTIAPFLFISIGLAIGFAAWPLSVWAARRDEAEARELVAQQSADHLNLNS